MFFCQYYHHRYHISAFVTLSTTVLLLFVGQTKSLFDADYFIQSRGSPNLCIEGGNIETNFTGKIFQNGEIETSPCKNIPEQQWHFQRQNESLDKDGGLYFNITSSASEAFYSQQLNANITGFFINYWPNPIQLIQLGKDVLNKTEYIIKDTLHGHCFENFGDGKQVKGSSCKDNFLNQTWTLMLVTTGNVSEAALPKSPYIPESTT